MIDRPSASASPNAQAARQACLCPSGVAMLEPDPGVGSNTVGASPEGM